jgi:hypothetical protein
MVKKAKGFGRSVSQKRWNEVSDKSFAKLEKSFVDDFGENAVLVRNAPDITKMSDVLKEFVSPYKHIPKDKKQLESLLTLAIAAWNLSFFPEEKWSKVTNEVFTDTYSRLKKGSENIEVAEALIQDLIERKLKYFADHHRRIINFQLAYLNRDEYHLTVVSST